MARVTICKKDFPRELPTVCVVCGEYAGDTVTHRFGRSWLSLYLIACVPWACCGATVGCLAVAIEIIWVARWSPILTLDVPVCESHTRHWANRRLLSWACVASTWISLMAGMSLSLNFRNLNVFHEVALIGTCVCWVAAWVLLVVLDQTGVRADDVLSDRVILAGVHPAFVAAVEDADPGE